MVKKTYEELSKDEIDILYDFIKRKSMFSANRTKLQHFLPEFNGKIYDKRFVDEMLENLRNVGYLYSKSIFNETSSSVSGLKIGDYEYEYDIKDSITYQGLYRRFRNRILKDKIFDWIRNLGTFLLNNLITIIVALITSVITTYITLKLFGN